MEKRGIRAFHIRTDLTATAWKGNALSGKGGEMLCEGKASFRTALNSGGVVSIAVFSRGKDTLCNEEQRLSGAMTRRAMNSKGKVAKGDERQRQGNDENRIA